MQAASWLSWRAVAATCFDQSSFLCLKIPAACPQYSLHSVSQEVGVCSQERNGARSLSPFSFLPFLHVLLELRESRASTLCSRCGCNPSVWPCPHHTPHPALPCAPKHPATYPAHETSARGISYGKSHFLNPVGNTK